MVGKLLREIERPNELNIDSLLKMVAASARVRYPVQMLKATEVCFSKLNKVSDEQLCELSRHLARTPLARVDDREVK